MDRMHQTYLKMFCYEIKSGAIYLLWYSSNYKMGDVSSHDLWICQDGSNFINSFLN